MERETRFHVSKLVIDLSVYANKLCIRCDISSVAKGKRGDYSSVFLLLSPPAISSWNHTKLPLFFFRQRMGREGEEQADGRETKVACRRDMNLCLSLSVKLKSLCDTLWLSDRLFTLDSFPFFNRGQPGFLEGYI